MSYNFNSIFIRILPYALLTSVFCIPSHSSFAAGWNCTFTTMSGSGKGLQGEAKIEVHGDAADWFVLMPSPVLGSNSTHWSKFPYRLLMNNDVGLVAASPEAVVAKDIGTVVASSTIAMNKKTGELHIGSISMLGANEIMAGHCKSK